MAKKEVEVSKKSSTKWVVMIFIFLIVAFFGLLFIGCVALLTGDSIQFGNVALIEINGPIMVSSGTSVFGERVASSTGIVENIKDADSDPSIQAIIFEINSPGGSAVASEEIANAIKNTNKTTVTYIREVGASGGYWIASATDYVFANRMSITGSIGVIASYLEFSGLLDHYNITYQRLVSGKYKDLGIPYKELTPDEEQVLMSAISSIHGYFVAEVAENRNLPIAEVEKLATGQFFIGSQALELGLIDAIGGQEEAISYVEEKLGITATIVEYRRDPTLLDLFSEAASEQSYHVGEGIGSAMFSKTRTMQEPVIWT